MHSGGCPAHTYFAAGGNRGLSKGIGQAPDSWGQKLVLMPPDNNVSAVSAVVSRLISERPQGSAKMAMVGGGVARWA